MPNPPFLISADVVGRTVDVTLRGFWSEGDVSAFDAALRDHLPSLAQADGSAGQHVTLLNCANFMVQPQPIVARLGLLAAQPALFGRHVAVIGAAPLLTLQIKRVAPHLRFFADRDTATEWLAEPLLVA